MPTLGRASPPARGFLFRPPLAPHLRLPDARKWLIEFGLEDLVFIGFPVYGCRLLHNSGQIFAILQDSGTPAVLIAVYGNRDYEDALLEMQREAEARGFVAIAAAAPVAEHCIAPEVAEGRPDEKDAATMLRFGQAVAA